MTTFLSQRATKRAVRQRRLLAAGVCLAALGFALSTTACGNDDSSKPTPAKVESVAAAARASNVISADTAGRTLASPGGAKAYVVDENDATRGNIRGDIRLIGVLPLDTMVVPNRDSTGCRSFLDVTLPLARGVRATPKDSSEHEIGNAVVWLLGVTHGPRDALPRRINLVLDGCHLDPRIMVAPTGATLNISNRDDMIVKLKFADLDRPATPRATIGFTDPGQIVPSALPLATPGLVQVVDENHPWIRAFIAVAPHPFVAVTEADGTFAFEGVPAGEYTLVVWHERLGARVVPAKVEAGVTSNIAVRY